MLTISRTTLATPTPDEAAEEEGAPPDAAAVVGIIIFCETTSMGTYTIIEALAAARPAVPLPMAAWTLASCAGRTARAVRSAEGRTPSSANMYAARAGIAPARTGPRPANKPRTPPSPTSLCNCWRREAACCCCDENACALVFRTLRGCSVAVRTEYRPLPTNRSRGMSTSSASGMGGMGWTGRGGGGAARGLCWWGFLDARTGWTLCDGCREELCFCGAPHPPPDKPPSRSRVRRDSPCLDKWVD